MVANVGCSTLTFHMLSFREALERIQRLGFTAIDLAMIAEFCPHADPHADEQQRARVAEAIARAGLKVTSINAWSLEFVNDEGGAEQAHIRGALRMAEAVGAPVVTVQPGGPVQPERWEESAPWVAELLNGLGAEAKAAGISLAVEAPHMGTFAEQFERACSLVDLLSRDEVGVALDTSHVLNGGGTIADALRRYGTRVRHVHLRDYRNGSIFVTPGDGVIDFAEVVGGLDSLGYAGGLSLELEYEEESTEVAERETIRARRFFHHMSETLFERAPGGGAHGRQ